MEEKNLESRDYSRDVDFKEILMRALIMSYAFSLVLLGSHDIRKDYGSVTNYLSGKSSKYVSQIDQRIDKELPSLRWEKVTKLFTKERAGETWKMRTREYLKTTPKKNQLESP